MKTIESISNKDLEAEILAIHDIVEISRKARRKQWFKNVLGRKRKKAMKNRQLDRTKREEGAHEATKPFLRGKRGLKSASVAAYKSYGLSS